jgi:hypothetical protein
MKKRIKQNVWGNWNGYRGRHKVIAFGTDGQAATEWLENEDKFLAEKAEAVKQPIALRKFNWKM